jgi:hypothetical protein
MRIVTASVLGAALIASAPAFAAVDITIDKSAQRMTVAVDGQVRHVWPVSTGKAGYDTPNGTFKAFRMEADHYSKEWDDAPMPHSIFFTQKGHAIHGSFDVKRIGSPASHGCVRLEPKNAAVLFALVKDEGVLKTTVTLTGAIRRGPAMARNTPQQRGVGAPMPIEPRGLRYGEPYGEPQLRQPRYAVPNYYYAEPQPYYAPRYQYYGPRGYAQPQPQPYYGNSFYRRQYRSNGYYYD